MTKKVNINRLFVQKRKCKGKGEEREGEMFILKKKENREKIERKCERTKREVKE